MLMKPDHDSSSILNVLFKITLVKITLSPNDPTITPSQTPNKITSVVIKNLLISTRSSSDHRPKPMEKTTLELPLVVTTAILLWNFKGLAVYKFLC